MSKILLKNFWAREFVTAISETELFHRLLSKFPQKIVKDRIIGAVAKKTYNLYQEGE